ncbi:MULTISPECIES: DUF7525 family protein [Halorussus]|uniref:DUF7525 family protein n=1 Tax=Halorussus TaxID=1070314 RepID=UPI00209F507B|nr:hypothetical protein [Halorussus vallis]USZ76275.1 hypothetical protein NGM07_02860 [Halorussus vallis]
MAEHETVSSDMGIGLATLFTLLATAATVAMVVTPGTEIAAWGFAAAMTAGVFAVAAVHLYW